MKVNFIITDPDLGVSFFTPYYFFKQQLIDERREASAAATVFQKFVCNQRKDTKREAKLWCNAMTPYVSQPYRTKQESHDTLFPIIKDTIISNFNKDTKIRYEHASNDIDSWCGATTIHSFMERHDMKMHANAPVPNLSGDQRRQRQLFYTKVTTNFSECQGGLVPIPINCNFERAHPCVPDHEEILGHGRRKQPSF